MKDVGTKKENLKSKFSELYRIIKNNKFLREGLCIIITMSFMSLLTCLAIYLKIPNPNMLLITGVVMFTALFGFVSGIAASLELIVYSIVLFKDREDALVRILVIVIGTIFCLLFVGFLHKYHKKAHNDLEETNAKLRQNVEALEKAAVTDQLTSLKNRLAFRNDYDGYEGKFVYLMMLDIDDFKGINDYYGHYAGDYTLKVMSQMIKSIFGAENCYRYGGDEFLVIMDRENLSPAEFEEIAIQLKKKVTDAYFNKTDFSIRFSAGYVYGTVENQDDLRYMLSQADRELYRAKNKGKNKICCAEYSRDEARKILGHVVDHDSAIRKNKK